MTQERLWLIVQPLGSRARHGWMMEDRAALLREAARVRAEGRALVLGYKTSPSGPVLPLESL